VITRAYAIIYQDIRRKNIMSLWGRLFGKRRTGNYSIDEAPAIKANKGPVTGVSPPPPATTPIVDLSSLRHPKHSAPPNGRYFEVSAPSDDNLFCSDDECPCLGNKKLEPGRDGYIYINPEVVEWRSDALRWSDLEAKLQRIEQATNAIWISTAGFNIPIYICEQGARLRGIDLEVAAADAENWSRTGLLPLRQSPKAPEHQMHQAPEQPTAVIKEDVLPKNVTNNVDLYAADMKVILNSIPEQSNNSLSGTVLPRQLAEAFVHIRQYITNGGYTGLYDDSNMYCVRVLDSLLLACEKLCTKSEAMDIFIAARQGGETTPSLPAQKARSEMLSALNVAIRLVGRRSEVIPLAFLKAQLDSERDDPETLSRCLYFACPKCGNGYHKEKQLSAWRTTLPLFYNTPQNLAVTGSRTCTCGTVMLTTDIYLGRYDLPRSRWHEVNGPTELTESEISELGQHGCPDKRKSDSPYLELVLTRILREPNTTKEQRLRVYNKMKEELVPQKLEIPEELKEAFDIIEYYFGDPIPNPINITEEIFRTVHQNMLRERAHEPEQCLNLIKHDPYFAKFKERRGTFAQLFKAAQPF
jgi:hypothetical protein